MSRPSVQDLTRFAIGLVLVILMWRGHEWAMYILVTCAAIAVEMTTLISREQTSIMSLLAEKVAHHGGWIVGHDALHREERLEADRREGG